MKIENKVDDNHKTFGELGHGDVFIQGDEIFMKTDSDDNMSNAIHLEDGCIARFFYDEKIRLVKATLIIE
jgi:hypothetical protein